MCSNKGKKFPAEVLSKEQQEALLGSFAQTLTGVRDRALTLLCLRSQLRCNEALDLRPCDVDLADRTVTVLRGKGGKRRVAGLGGGDLSALEEWMAIRPDSQWLFCTRKGTRMDSSAVRRLMKRQARRAGIAKRVHPHGLRHSGAFVLASQVPDLRIVQRQLGHSSLAVTDRYINHLCPAQVVNAVNSVEW